MAIHFDLSNPGRRHVPRRDGARCPCRRGAEADLGYPIILGADGRVMDGMHRVAKAYLAGQEVVSAVQLTVDPAPDFVGVDEDALPYDETLHDHTLHDWSHP